MYRKTIIRSLWFIALMLPLYAHAQLLPNGDFSSYNCTDFSDTCVVNWRQTHGDPTLRLDGNQPNPYAWMWSYNRNGEGIITDYNFQPGKCYKITMRVKVNHYNISQIANKAAFHIEATTTAPFTYGGRIPSPDPTTRKSIENKRFFLFNNNSWTVVTYLFSPNKNYNHLWIYPRYEYESINDKQAELSIDDVSITERTTEADPSVTVRPYCAPDGTISLEVNAPDTGANHWYGLFEVPTQGAVTGGTHISSKSGGNGYTTHTFTGLDHDKFYYIKHGMYNNCIQWTEVRVPFSGEVTWTPRTADFSISPGAVLNNLFVNLTASPNSVDAAHWWGLFLSNNGSVSGNTLAPGTVVQWGPTTRFTHLQSNTWYYVKHGVMNSCAGWIEKRTPFIINTANRESEDGAPEYEIVFGEEETVKLTPEYIQQTEEALLNYPFYYQQEEEQSFRTSMLENAEFPETDTDATGPGSLLQVYPNPSSTQQPISILSPALAVREVGLFNLKGQRIEVEKTGDDPHQPEISTPDALDKGVYVLKVSLEDGSTQYRRIVIN